MWTGIRIISQISIGIALNDRQAARDAGGNIVPIKLHPPRINLAFIAQRRHQRAIAAADIENAAARSHFPRDDRKVRPQHRHA